MARKIVRIALVSVVALAVVGMACGPELPWGRRITGRITAQHGGVEVSLPNTNVFLQSTQLNDRYGGQATTSDTLGAYDMQAPWYGEYELCASAPGFQTACHLELVHLIYAGGVFPVRDLALEPSADAVRGKVTLEGGTACDEIATIVLMEAGIVFSSTTTNTLGEYVLAQLPSDDPVDFEVTCAGELLDRKSVV